jgi:hypothetical protein
MEVESKRLTTFLKNTRTFRTNFEKLFAISNCNLILILTAREFRIIDVRIIPPTSI